jgi:hypothetical protein
VDISISIDQEPAAGTYGPETPGASGTLDVGYGTHGPADDFEAASDGGAGDWTLDITSVAQGHTNRHDEVWAPHGSLTATLTDADGGIGTLQLTF